MVVLKNPCPNYHELFYNPVFESKDQDNKLYFFVGNQCLYHRMVQLPIIQKINFNWMSMNYQILLQDHAFTVSHKIKLTHLKVNAFRSQWPGTTTLIPAVSCLQWQDLNFNKEDQNNMLLITGKKNQSN